MSEKVKIVRIFIGSPGGLDGEREAARDVVQELNQAHSEHWGCQLKLVGWEDTIPGYQRAQSLINRDLDKCEYFIGALWDRWGTKPDNDENGYTSGFEEEYNRAKSLIASGKMKDLVIYFKKVETPKGFEPGEDIKKVMAFRTSCINEKTIFFKDFVTTAEFQNLVRYKLSEIGWREAEFPNIRTDLEVNPEQLPSSTENADHEQQSSERLLDQDALNFLSNLSTRSPDWDETSALEVARFRLIAASLNRAGNDELYLGNHDANLIFHDWTKISLGAQEIRALVDCGIAGFDSQNVPLWRWLVLQGGGKVSFARPSLLAIVGNSREKRNSINLLNISSQSIPTLEEYYNKNMVISMWFSEDSDNSVSEAASSFLQAHGELDDLNIFDEICPTLSPQKRALLSTAAVGIISRDDATLALEKIVSEDVERISDEICHNIFSKHNSIKTQTLLSCLLVKSDNVRLEAVEILFSRESISLDQAEVLLSDSNYQIRVIAAKTFLRAGRELDKSTLKSALTIQHGISGIFGLNRSRLDEKYLDSYNESRLKDLQLSELRKIISEHVIFNDKETLALYTAFPKQSQNEIRKNLEDGFFSYFEDQINNEESSGRLTNDRAKQIRDLTRFRSNRLASRAIEILCGLNNGVDLGLVRSVCDNFVIDGSEEVLKFLAKFGDWSDVPRIIALPDPTSSSLGLLSLQERQLAKAKAASLYALGRHRIADLLDLDIDRFIRLQIARQISKKSLSELDDSIILRELDRKDDGYRSVFALRCVSSLTKSRISNLLESYIYRDKHRYYNVIHWLDLGVALPQKEAIGIAERQLELRK